MPADLNIFKSYLACLIRDERITVWHIAMILGFIQLANSADLGAPINITRRKVMQLAHISNFMTYHKCIRELQQFGYILYHPSYHPAHGSRVHFLAR